MHVHPSREFMAWLHSKRESDVVSIFHELNVRFQTLQERIDVLEAEKAGQASRLDEMIRNIDCDSSKANDEYSDRRSAYEQAFQDALQAAASLVVCELTEVPQRD